MDLSQVKTSRELQQLLLETFNLPGWYGMNWDAFHDSITDPEQSSLPETLIVIGWQSLAARLPQDARYLREDLDGLATGRPECTVVWAQQSSRCGRLV